VAARAATDCPVASYRVTAKWTRPRCHVGHCAWVVASPAQKAILGRAVMSTGAGRMWSYTGASRQIRDQRAECPDTAGVCAERDHACPSLAE
jgi:hypothetical protein